jgi:uncharacterized protein (TIGR03437 family)
MSRFTVFSLLVVVFLTVFPSGVNAQISSVRIFTKPAGATFYVDEQAYTNEVTLLWPAGSKHFIRTQPEQSAATMKAQYQYTGATTNLGTPGSIWPITADPGLTYIELDFTVSYAVSLSYYPCPLGLGACTSPTFPPPQAGPCKDMYSVDGTCWPPSPGMVMVGGTIYWADADIYLGAGASVQAEAHPAQGCSGSMNICSGGWIFTGWGMMPGVPSASTFIWTFPLNQPQSLHPLFQQAQPIQISVGCEFGGMGPLGSTGTSPGTPPTRGVQILIDRTPVVCQASPVQYYWGWGTDHQVGAIASQRDGAGHLVVFDSWSDGGEINHVLHVTGGASAPMSLTARFVPGAAVTFLTSPPGLSLSIDGRKNWQSYNFNWAQGTTHTISAPATQTDAQGRLYKFVSWSNGADATQKYTVSDAPDDVRITATYQPVAQVNVSSVPSGIAVQVDGASCTTPCSLQRDVGAKVTLSAPAIAPSGDGSRLVFQGWADSTSATRTLVTSSADPVTLNATYQLQYQLATGANPPDGVLWSISPATNDGFYNAQSVVALSASARDGYRFLGWSGDASGVTQPLAVTMTSPKNITVMLDPVPFVPQGGVKNAAGDTPDQTVAPGSVITISGVNLAAGSETGPAAPLKQSLSGVTVKSEGLLTPLFFVTPNQINAQLPFEIDLGPQTLTVSVPGKPDVAANFTVARNAPGLFANPVGDTAYVLASHADGSAVTPDSPAVQGETITVYGTGFGPYVGTAPDGFALPQGPNFLLVDPVDIVAGSMDLQPTYAGAATQKVGVNAVSFTIDPALPTGTNVPLKVRINGHESNTVILPLQ